MSEELRGEWEGESLKAQERGPFHSPKRPSFRCSEVSPQMAQARWAPWWRRRADGAGAEAAGAEWGRAGRGAR